MTRGKIGLLLGAAAVAYGAYRYTKMTTEEKNELKAKGKKMLDKNLGSVNNLFSGKTSPANGTPN